MSKSYPERAKELVRQMRAQSKEGCIETQTRASVDPISVPWLWGDGSSSQMDIDRCKRPERIHRE